MVYIFLLLFGASGFILMSVMGAAHGIGGHHSHGLSGSRVGGSQHGGSHHHPGGHQGPGARTGGRAIKGGAKENVRHSESQSNGLGWLLLTIISPINVFSLMFGAGAVGTLLKALVKGWELIGFSVVGALIFTLGIVHPLMGFLMGFASKPSDGLEGEVASVAEAISNFDSQGRGMVRLSLDEQVVQLLAYLEPGERESGVKVRRGEKVVLVSVDAKRNTCTVSRELAPSAN